MSSSQAKMINEIFKKIPADDPNVPHDYVKERALNASRMPPRIPHGITVTVADFHGITGEIISPEEAKENYIWYIHGGGFTTGSASERRDITYFLAKEMGYEVISTNYRLAPENKWPAGFDDCRRVYDAIVEKGYDPTHMICMGESAGATLALSTVLRLRDEGQVLPRAVVAFSPVTNQADDLPSHRENVATDYMIKDTLLRHDMKIAVFGEEKPALEILKNPYVSPYFGDYHGMPPIFLSASDTEVLYDDSASLFEKLKMEKHMVMFDVAHDVCHAYPMFPMMPEGRKTVRKAICFVEQAVR